MPIPRVRFTVRSLMIVVAMAAIVLATGLLTLEFWQVPVSAPRLVREVVEPTPAGDGNGLTIMTEIEVELSSATLDRDGGDGVGPRDDMGDRFSSAFIHP